MLPYLVAAGACALTSWSQRACCRILRWPNIVMLFLLNVVLVSALRAAARRSFRHFSLSHPLISSLAYNFSFAVSDVQYLLTFAIMLAVALITAQLTAGLKIPGTNRRRHREGRARALSKWRANYPGAVDV
ncbi:MAG: DUF4118 domain-containing protein [Betaproteobacteria bacterium]|nr:DUF4118 domain-containing protein [Betaproteobacteria bacterium]